MAVVTQYPASNAAHGALGQLTNPANAYSDNGVYATAAPGKNVTKANEYGTFGFDVILPASCTIDKIQIIYEFKVSVNTSIATARVHSLVSGSAQANHDDATEPLSDKTVTVNITADRTWTRANLLNGVLTVALEAVQGNSSTAVTFSFDYVKVEVTYTQTATGTFTISGNGAVAMAGKRGAKAQSVISGGGLFSTTGVKKTTAIFLISGNGNTGFSGTKKANTSFVISGNGSMVFTYEIGGSEESTFKISRYDF
jgi:hypothetical protein